jgi:hypothetical protein
MHRWAPSFATIFCDSKSCWNCAMAMASRFFHGFGKMKIIETGIEWDFILLGKL